MSRAGVVAALAAEARALAPLRSHGTLVRVSGVGPERAAVAARELLARGASALVGWGVAGGLDPELAPGDVVVAAGVVSPGGATWSTDAPWGERVTRRLSGELSVRRGTVLGSPRAILGADEKHELFRRTGAVAVDMESAAVAAVAAEAGVPFLVVRAISDPAALTVPGWVGAGLADGEVRPVAVALSLLGHPWRVPATLRLWSAYRAACRSLLRVARRTGGGFLIEAGDPDPAVELEDAGAR